MIFDQMTLKSNQFIGFARYSCPKFDCNPSVSSNENALTSYFCMHNEPQVHQYAILVKQICKRSFICSLRVLL